MKFIVSIRFNILVHKCMYFLKQHFVSILIHPQATSKPSIQKTNRDLKQMSIVV